MQSLSTRFKKLKTKMPGVGDIPLFFLSLDGSDEPRNVRCHFRKRVSLEEYAPEEHKQIIDDMLARKPIITSEIRAVIGTNFYFKEFYIPDVSCISL